MAYERAESEIQGVEEFLRKKDAEKQAIKDKMKAEQAKRRKGR